MRNRFRPKLLLASALVALATWAASVALPAPSRAPETRVDGVVDTLHQVLVPDLYRWLEDQDSPETRAWIAAQNAHTESVLAPVPGADRLRELLEPLMKVETTGIPFERGGRYFYTRRAADQELSVLHMRRGLDGPEEVLVDPHALSQERSTSVGFLDVSEDGRLLAYSTRRGGEDEVTITFLDVDTRRELPDRFPRARYFGVSIEPDRRGVYYARHGAQGSRVYHHLMGADPAGDTLVFGEGFGPGSLVAPALSDDGRYLLITVSHGSAAEKSEIYIQDLASRGPIVPVVRDLTARFSGRIAGDRLYLETNWGAPNGRILAVDLAHPSREHWREIVPASSAVIDGFSLAGGRLFVTTLENVISTVRIFDPTGAPRGRLTFPVPGSVGTVNGRWGSSEAFFSFASFHIPTTIYRHEVTSGRQRVWWRAKIPLRAANFDVRQVWYASKDGTRIPMFLVHRKGLKLDGSNPTLLTGYGGFTLSQTPSFTPRAAAWVELGGVFALPNLRGGSEFGEPWHRAGMLERKQNVFDDFIAAAEWLIRNGYTRPERLAIAGRSNGGLLVGAALTQRPDLFRAVICGFPLLDMVRYHQFLVARFWVPEYGSSEDSAQFRTLLAYSPYHRVKKGEQYPAALFVSGDFDTRVAPLHARKMTALLQASTGSERPILLHYDTHLGHSSGQSLSRQMEDLTLELQFLQWQLGMVPQVAGSGVATGN